MVAGEVGGAGGGVGEVPLPRRAAEAVRGPKRHKEIIRNAATCTGEAVALALVSLFEM